MSEKFKEFFRKSKAKAMLACLTAATVFCVTCVPVMASESSIDYGTQISNALTTAVSNIVTNTVTLVAAVLPTALTILGVFLTLKTGIRVIKKATSA